MNKLRKSFETLKKPPIFSAFSPAMSMSVCMKATLPLASAICAIGHVVQSLKRKGKPWGDITSFGMCTSGIPRVWFVCWVIFVCFVDCLLMFVDL